MNILRREPNFSLKQKILNLCLTWHILWSYCFAVGITLKQTSSFQLQVCFSMYDLSVTTRHWKAEIFTFQQMIALKKLWKMFFITSKKALFFLEICKFLYFHFPPFFFLPAIALKFDPRLILKVYDVISCPTKNLKAHSKIWDNFY